MFASTTAAAKRALPTTAWLVAAVLMGGSAGACGGGSAPSTTVERDSAAPTGISAAEAPTATAKPPTSTVHTSTMAPPRPSDSIDVTLGMTARPLTVGTETALPAGVVLYIESGGLDDEVGLLRVTVGGDGRLRKEVLSGFAEAYRPTVSNPQFPFGITSWSGDDSMREMYATLCLGKPEGCSCASGLHVEPPGALLFRSLDGGQTWSVFSEVGIHDSVVGMDGGGVIVMSRGGCSTLGPFTYRSEPGGVEIPYPRGRGEVAVHYGRVLGLGWLWSKITYGSIRPDGTAARPTALGDRREVSAAAAAGGVSYWSTGGFLLETDAAGNPSALWSGRGANVSFLAVAGERLFFGELYVTDESNPDPRRHFEYIPVMVDMAAGVVHPIAGLTPGPGEPEVRLRAVVKQ